MLNNEAINNTKAVEVNGVTYHVHPLPAAFQNSSEYLEGAGKRA